MKRFKETAILINTRDRIKELNQLLESLNNQTYQNFNIFILDDASKTPIEKQSLVKSENEKFLKRSEKHLGVSAARQIIVDWVLNSKNKYKYFCRLDDDVILEKDYIERLINVINLGFDIASGVTPTINSPTEISKQENLYVEQEGLATSNRVGEVMQLSKENKEIKLHGRVRKFSAEGLGGHQPAISLKSQSIKPIEPIFQDNIINRAIFDSKGNYIKSNDDCGTYYDKSIILPAHFFRSCALYKPTIHNKVNYLPTNLSKHGFREEQIFSYKSLMAGFKIGVDTKAIAHHQRTPYGGERFPNEEEFREYNQKILEKFIEENKEKLLPVLNPK
jgi:glycosyltransferase involved in cell wall biosynthesis